MYISPQTDLTRMSIKVMPCDHVIIAMLALFPYMYYRQHKELLSLISMP